MDIKEKQARWAVERPLFEAEFIHSHLLPFFNFNENTGDYEIKSEFSEDEDKELAFEVLNTGWVMWLRAKRTVKAVPEENALLSATLDAVQKLGGGEFVLVEKDLIHSIYQSCIECLDVDIPPIFRATVCTIRDEVEPLIEAQEPTND